MLLRRNTKLAEWAEVVLGKHGGLSLRQAEIRTGVSYATVKGILEGRAVGAETVIRFAQGFGEDVPKALRLAGYPDIADVWEKGAAPSAVAESSPAYDTKTRKLIRSYTDEGLTDEDREEAAALLEAFLRERKKRHEKNGAQTRDDNLTSEARKAEAILTPDERQALQQLMNHSEVNSNLRHKIDRLLEKAG